MILGHHEITAAAAPLAIYFYLIAVTVLTGLYRAISRIKGGRHDRT